MSRGVLFDVDGLLVDSETLGARVFQQVVSSRGIEITFEEAERYQIGRQDKDSYTLFCQEKGQNLNVDELVQQHFFAYEKELPKVPELLGAKDIVRRCYQLGYKIAAVSGSTLYQVGIILGGLSVRELFAEIISCDLDIAGKPAPDGYLEAARRLNVPIGNCLVFEDSSSGIVAGKKAGAHVVGVQGNGKQDISQADYQVHSLKEITDEFLVGFGT
ncbi:MAG: HAD family phosphatase [Thaumarchaeota archaeon]|nr:HAD family phosphatase [Nitrososphaerota archaeon]